MKCLELVGTISFSLALRIRLLNDIVSDADEKDRVEDERIIKNQIICKLTKHVSDLVLTEIEAQGKSIVVSDKVKDRYVIVPLGLFEKEVEKQTREGTIR